MNELPADPNIFVLPMQLKFCVALFLLASPFFISSCGNLSVVPDFSYSSEEGLTISTTLKVIKQQEGASK